MGRMEVITGTEHRRSYGEARKAVVVADAPVPGVTVRAVSRCTMNKRPKFGSRKQPANVRHWVVIADMAG